MIGVSANDRAASDRAAAAGTPARAAPGPGLDQASRNAFQQALQQTGQDPSGDGQDEPAAEDGTIQDGATSSVLSTGLAAAPFAAYRALHRPRRDAATAALGEERAAPALPQLAPPRPDAGPARTSAAPTPFAEPPEPQPAQTDPAQVQALRVQLGDGPASALALDIVRQADGALSLNLAAGSGGSAQARTALDDLRRRLTARGVRLSDLTLEEDPAVIGGASAGDA